MSFDFSPIYNGIATALVTPFLNGRVDLTALGEIIDRQIAGGASALVACGTTGEASTLTESEQAEVIRFAVGRASGRVPIIAGSGSNCTKKAVDLSVRAESMGANALLVVTPYYNKASSEGLVAHFTAIADSVSIPIILYNVPSRTGVDIPLGVYEKLAAHKRIVALKEARGNTDTVKLLRSEGIPLTVYSGDDRLLCEMLDCGALGCISASSNVIPRQMADICKLYFGGDVEAARGLEASLSELYDAMFCQVNPIPVKHAMSLMGLCGNEMRLPLCPPSERFAESIKSVLMKYGLIS